jgi:hypothetical protein
MDSLVVGSLDPGGEQPVEHGQVRDARAVADLDQKLLADGAEESFGLPSSLRFTGRTVGDLDAEPGGCPLQRRVAEGAAVIDVMKNSS